MDKKLSLAPLATVFAATLATAPTAHAADNPFALTEFRGGMQVAEGNGEMKCGASMDMGQAEAPKDAAQAEAKAETAKAEGAQKAEAQVGAAK